MIRDQPGYNSTDEPNLLWFIKSEGNRSMYKLNIPS